MKTYINRGKIDRDDGRTTFYTELEIQYSDDIIVTIRRYTSKTFVAIKNECRHYTKILFRDFHRNFDFIKIMTSVIFTQGISTSSGELGEIRKQYRKMEAMPIIDKEVMVF